jgi:hypothetical protein
MATKQENRIKDIARQQKALEALFKICTGKDIDGALLFRKLRRMECKAERWGIDYCNADISIDEWEKRTDEYEKQINKLFEGNLKGFFVNGDARGYALKINDDTLRKHYSEIGLHRDWGGYGILAPDFKG